MMDMAPKPGRLTETFSLRDVPPATKQKGASLLQRVAIGAAYLLLVLAVFSWPFGEESAAENFVAADAIGTLTGSVSCDDPANDVRRVRVADVGEVATPAWIDARQVKVSVTNSEVVVQWKLDGSVPHVLAGANAWNTNAANFQVVLQASDPAAFAGEPLFAYINLGYASGEWVASAARDDSPEGEQAARPAEVEVRGNTLVARVGLDAFGLFPSEFMIFANTSTHQRDGVTDGFWVMTDALCGDVDSSRFSEETVG